MSTAAFDVEEQDEAVEAAPQAMEATQEKPRRARGVLNSPWLLAAVGLLIGGIWLVNHLDIITNNLDKPYLLLAGPAIAASALAVWLIVTFFKVIANWCKTAWQAFLVWRTQSGSSYWIIIAVFLLVSVSESGTYFNGLLGSNDLYGTLGYASAFVIDLVAVECMRARLGAVRMRDAAGKRLYLLGVVVCAGLSAYANTYTALMHFVQPKNTLLPDFMVISAPWTGMAFPLLIIFLSFTADYTADQASTKLDPEAYKLVEEKRLKLLEYQREALRRRVEIERDLDALNKQLHPGKAKEKVQREFILQRLLFPRVQPDAQKIVEQVLCQVEATKDAQLEQVLCQIEAANHTQFSWLKSQQENLQTTVESLTLQMTNQTTQMSTEVQFRVDDEDDSFDMFPPDSSPDFEDDADVNTDEHEIVNSVSDEQMARQTPSSTPRPRITVKLNDIPRQKERNTDQLAKTAKKRTSGESEAVKIVRRMVKRNREISPQVLAEKANISRQYASEIKSKVLKELSA